MVAFASDPSTQDWFARWWPIVVPIFGILLTASATGIWAIINRRGQEKNKAKIPLPPTWPEMWARLDKQDQMIARLEQRIDDLEQENEKLKAENGKLRADKKEILQHVVTLERLLPEPPPHPLWSPDQAQDIKL